MEQNAQLKIFKFLKQHLSKTLMFRRNMETHLQDADTMIKFMLNAKATYNGSVKTQGRYKKNYI
jgi:hypothetical protein